MPLILMFSKMETSSMLLRAVKSNLFLALLFLIKQCLLWYGNLVFAVSSEGRFDCNANHAGSQQEPSTSDCNNFSWLIVEWIMFYPYWQYFSHILNCYNEGMCLKHNWIIVKFLQRATWLYMYTESQFYQNLPIVL